MRALLRPAKAGGGRRDSAQNGAPAFRRGIPSLALSAAAIVAPGWGDDPPAPVQLTAQQDHRRMMELLGIKELRPGANPRDPATPNAPNYDEAKANPYP